MSFRIAIAALVLTTAAQLASAAPTLFAVGSMSASAFPAIPEALPPFNFNQDYEQQATASDPALSVSRTQFYFGSNSMHYDGTAQFGRLSTRASISAPGGAIDYDISYSSSLSVSFEDVLKVPGLVNGFLALDFELDGIFNGVGAGADFGAYYNNGNEAFACAAQLNPGLVAFVDPVCASGSPSDVTLTPIGGGDWRLYTKRTFVVPLGPDGVDLFVAVRARAVCPELSFCSADLGHTALIGNVKVYDSSFQLRSDLSVVSDSGYDYLIPPAAPAVSDVPEPATYATFGAGLLLVVALRRPLKLRKRL
jgi:hypothetical protein